MWIFYFESNVWALLKPNSYFSPWINLSSRLQSSFWVCKVVAQITICSKDASNGLAYNQQPNFILCTIQAKEILIFLWNAHPVLGFRFTPLGFTHNPLVALHVFHQQFRLTIISLSGSSPLGPVFHLCH